MSSFIGHSLAAVTVFVGTELCTASKNNRLITRKHLGWLGWLVIVASLPDLDYVVHSWNSINNQGVRVTHSVLFSLIAPIITVGFLIRGRSPTIVKSSVQVLLAGLSHLVLDLLVGVTPLPLAFPFFKHAFKLSWGILPSAGKIAWNNYYFYRNLALELGVLLPTFGVVCLLGNRLIASPAKINRFWIFLLLMMLFCLGYFVTQNLRLPR